ncbi:hypothetical protein K435DRAFT_781345 [Dendrothele bispora CBS 962.96]|uniref:Hypervirulence associated protein TUDOR domain-containing protein n=1 Tax=Dendrothele bispora (strain CBS 962.96) TaxID=1314807 RepID=A0A4S8LM93_DENBC|nr:hypothetical protein K435DRAFT_781345 [Dendrothele bispora CBS 962.96]
MSSNQFSVGDRVEYQGIGGGNVENSTTHGEVTGIVQSKQEANEAGVQANVSPFLLCFVRLFDDPRYVIRNDNTGKETAYKPQNIKGVEGRD